MEFIPKYIKQILDWRDSEKITAQQYNAILNLLVEQGDNNTEFLTNIADAVSTTEEVKKLIDQKIVEISSADMAQAVYDVNNNGIVDYAEQTLDNAVLTKHIKNGNVTEVKLSKALQDKLTYLSNKISQILIMFGVDSEISGSEGLLTFGWDGALNSGYRVDTAYNIEDVVCSGNITSGTKVVESEAPTTWNANKEVVIQGTNRTYTNKISSITEASFTNSNVIVPLPATAADEYSNVRCCHITEDYFVVASTGDDGDYDRLQIRVLKITNNTITEVLSKYFSRLLMPNFKKIGDTVYASMQRWDNSDYIRYRYIKITKDAITNETYSASYDISRGDFAAYGDYIYYRANDSDSNRTSIVKSNLVSGGSNETAVITFAEDRCEIIHQLSSEIAFLTYRLNDVYFLVWINLKTGEATTINLGDSEENGPPEFQEGLSGMDPTGTYFYTSEGKYKINTSTKVITTITKAEIYGGLFIAEDVYLNNNTIYRVKDGKSVLVYDLNKHMKFNTIDGTAVLKSIAIDEGLTKGVMGTQTTTKTLNPYAECFTLTLPKVTFVNTFANSIENPVIKRSCDCIIPANTTRYLYLTVENLDNVVFTDLNLIIKLDRAETSEDLINVYYNTAASETFTAVGELNTSTTSTKYYEVTGQSSATWSVKIVVTTGSQPLTLTNILGGVDNGV